MENLEYRMSIYGDLIKDVDAWYFFSPKSLFLSIKKDIKDSWSWSEYKDLLTNRPTMKQNKNTN